MTDTLTKEEQIASINEQILALQEKLREDLSLIHADVLSEIMELQEKRKGLTNG